jgi:hypothetical protein
MWNVLSLQKLGTDDDFSGPATQTAKSICSVRECICSTVSLFACGGLMGPSPLGF